MKMIRSSTLYKFVIRAISFEIFLSNFKYVSYDFSFPTSYLYLCASLCISFSVYLRLI